MTVQTSTDRADYTGNASTTAFTVPFYFLDPTHLIAYLTVIATGAVTTLILNSDYTVAGAGVGTGGTLTTTVAPLSTQRLSILRNVPLVQLTHYVPNDPFPAASHENALDLLTMIAQQVTEAQARALSFPPADPASITPLLPAAGARANMLLGFDSLGNVTTTAPVAGTATALASQLVVSNSPSSGAGQVGWQPGISYGANTVGAELNALVATFIGKSKTSNLGRTSNAVLDDPDLVCAVGTGLFAFRLYLPVWQATGAGIKFNVTCSGIATGQFSYVATVNGSTTALNSAGTLALGTTASIPQILLAGPGPGNVDVIVIDGVAVVTVAGNLKLQWGQSITNATATNIGAGAWMTCTKVG